MRNARVDILRSLAILLVILAHASPPEWMMQIRISNGEQLLRMTS